jgi:TRAP-type C4-dicarboxylate transport system permease small subunit
MLAAPTTEGIAWDSALTTLVWIYRAVLIGLVTAIVAIVSIAVVFRYVLNMPLIFSFDLATILFVWLVFLGLAQAAHEGAHLAVDLFTGFLPESAARALDVLVRLLMVAIAMFLIRYSWDLAMRTRMEIASMRISMIWVYMAVPIGFLIFALYEAFSLVRLAIGRPLARSAS